MKPHVPKPQVPNEQDPKSQAVAVKPSSANVLLQTMAQKQFQVAFQIHLTKKMP